MIYLLNQTALFCVCSLILTMIQSHRRTSGLSRAIHECEQYYSLKTLCSGRQQHSSVMPLTTYSSKWGERAIRSFLLFSPLLPHTQPWHLEDSLRPHLLVTGTLHGRPVTWCSHDGQRQRYTEKEGTRLIEARDSWEGLQKCPPEVVAFSRSGKRGLAQG